MKIIINENQRGLQFRSGKFQKMLNPGKYYIFGENEVETVSTEAPLSAERCSLETLLRNGEIAQQVSPVEVEDQHLALHFVNGKFKEALTAGKYAFWTVLDAHTYQMVDISSAQADETIPAYIFSALPEELYTEIDVLQYQKASLYIDNRFVQVLEPGTYYFWNNGSRIEAQFADTRLTQMNVSGQEILTQDKVSLRINFTCTYRITDPVRILTEIDNYEEQIHVAVQMALREYVSKYKLDDILESKEQISQYVLQKIKSKESDFFVNFTDGGVKDIILPGEIREIMNTVLAAEKKAQASVITRREEVASTRSLLNTAKLMDENQTLYRLKELEYIERICENVDSLNLNGSGDILAQLTSILKGNTAR